MTLQFGGPLNARQLTHNNAQAPILHSYNIIYDAFHFQCPWFLSFVTMHACRERYSSSKNPSVCPSVTLWYCIVVQYIRRAFNV